MIKKRRYIAKETVGQTARINIFDKSVNGRKRMREGDSERRTSKCESEKQRESGIGTY
jgi:hypothetical protein